MSAMSAKTFCRSTMVIKILQLAVFAGAQGHAVNRHGQANAVAKIGEFVAGCPYFATKDGSHDSTCFIGVQLLALNGPEASILSFSTSESLCSARSSGPASV